MSRGAFELRFHLRICHAFREIRPDEPRRNDRDAQLLAGLHAQALGDCAHGELRGGIDRLVRHGLCPAIEAVLTKCPKPCLRKRKATPVDAHRCGCDAPCRSGEVIPTNGRVAFIRSSPVPCDIAAWRPGPDEHNESKRHVGPALAYRGSVRNSLHFGPNVCCGAR